MTEQKTLYAHTCTCAWYYIYVHVHDIVHTCKSNAHHIKYNANFFLSFTGIGVSLSIAWSEEGSWTNDSVCTSAKEVNLQTFCFLSEECGFCKDMEKQL